MKIPTVLIVPGLRDHAPQHWQTLLEERLHEAGKPVTSVPPMGRNDLDCGAKVAAIERVAQSLAGPIVILAHSAGCIMVVHWARQTKRVVHGALLAAPPDFERPMPEGYPTLEALRVAGWLPVPREQLPFRSIVGSSRNDPLGTQERVSEFARAWGSETVDLGEVGHLNPASGFGPWPMAEALIARLTTGQAIAP
jgi:predicted alpha/beta hydrolase family esterase